MKKLLPLYMGAAVALSHSSVWADSVLLPIVISATKMETLDTEATYASEVYRADEIEESGATSLYDFLNQNSSMVILPSYGNPYTQRVDMRGYGISGGYQNIVITVDGRRMNNIDMSPQLLSSIPLKSIDRIEITKGSGSILYGDGAMAGSIQIYTKDAPTNQLSLLVGNHGKKVGSFSTGLSEAHFQLLVSADHSALDGFSEADSSGEPDESDSNSSRIQLRLFPTEETELSIEKEHAMINTRYIGHLTEGEFNDNPAQNSGNLYTPQQFETDVVTLGLTTTLSNHLDLSLRHSQEDKYSNFLNGWGRADYEYQTDEIRINYDRDNRKLTAGFQQFDGDRTNAGVNTTRKKNSGYFVQGELIRNNTTFSLGGRSEQMDYTYAPTSGVSRASDHHLSAYDIGLNHTINGQISLFSNYNTAFQAPDVDRFFNWGGSFNDFISPAESKTVNIGVNQVTPVSKSKLTLYRSNLDNEIYYYANGFTNTNIDQSHKYGLELQNHYQWNEPISTSINYAYTRAIIDQENEGGGSFNGKDLPGVSRHNLTLGLKFRLGPDARVVASHTYRSAAYAADDFSNLFLQKQQPYHATDLLYTQTLEGVVLTAGVSNLFEKSNGIWVEDDVIYPVNFTRNWNIGVKFTF